MSSKTLEQYLASLGSSGIIDHALHASVDSNGKVTFYIHPAGVDGDTLDFVVRGNSLVPNVTNDSDVAGDGDESKTAYEVGAPAATHNPVHLAVDLSHAIGRLAETGCNLHAVERSKVNDLITAMAGKAIELLFGPIAVACQAPKVTQDSDLSQIPKHPSHPDVPRPSDAELVELARGVCHAIEAYGAGPELTHAVTLASDLAAYLQKPRTA